MKRYVINSKQKYRFLTKGEMSCFNQMRRPALFFFTLTRPFGLVASEQIISIRLLF